MIKKFIDLTAETEKAYLWDFGKYSAWIPKSVCTILNLSTIEIEDWFEMEIIKNEKTEDLFDEIEEPRIENGINLDTHYLDGSL